MYPMVDEAFYNSDYIKMILCVDFRTMRASGYMNMLCLLVRVHEQAFSDKASIFQWKIGFLPLIHVVLSEV